MGLFVQYQLQVEYKVTDMYAEVPAMTVMATRLPQWQNRITWSTGCANPVVWCSNENCPHQLLTLQELFTLTHTTFFLQMQPSPLTRPRVSISAMAWEAGGRKEERLTYQANFCLSTQTQTLGGPWRNPPQSLLPARTTACHWLQWTGGKKREEKWEDWCQHSKYTLPKAMFSFLVGVWSEMLYSSHIYTNYMLFFVLEFRQPFLKAVLLLLALLALEKAQAVYFYVVFNFIREKTL